MYAIRSYYDCYRITLVPKPESAVVWGKIVYYARKHDYLPVKEEFYNQHNVLKKTMTMSEFTEMGGRVIPAVYKMETLSKKDRYTMLRIKFIRFNVTIPDRVFTIQNLKGR